MKSVLASLLLAGTIACPVVARAQSEVANGIAVIVNDAVITYKDVQDYILPALELLERQYSRQPQVLRQKLVEAQRDGIEQLVERQLILNDFKVSGYNIPESIIEDAIKDRIRERFGDRVTLTKTLQAQGTTFESFRQQVREQIIVEALRQKHVSSELLISPHKIETYYNENRDQFKVDDRVKLRMIVINQPANGPEGFAKKLAQEIRLKIQEGTPFEEMASIYSEGSQRAQGGDWGWVERSVLREELAETAFKIEPGKLSEVIETPQVCYLMLVEERKTANIRPLEEVRDEIEKTLLTQERTRLHKKYIDRLKEKSFVRYF